MANFIEDVKKLRAAARKNIENGIITENYSADVNEIIRLLNIALATELVCTLRYKNHHHKAKELGASIAAAEFLEHATQEQEHADNLAERLTQLGATPNMDPANILKNSHAEYIECDNIGDMIKENLIAERIAIDSYRQLIKYIGNDDPTTRRLIEEILIVEEEHADDMLDLKVEYNVTF